jgi:hypothetical protein
MIKLRDKFTFPIPEIRIREYCRVEIYHSYDGTHSIDNVVSCDDIKNANHLYAWITNSEAIRLLAKANTLDDLLKSIPAESSLIQPDSTWLATKETVGRLLAEFLSVKGIGIAKTTKILQLKRPSLFPILDSFVMDFLMSVKIENICDKRKLLQLGLRAIEKIRVSILKQESSFKELNKKLTDLPIPLSDVRCFDILCWTTQKWDIQNNLKSPYGTPSVSLLKNINDDAPTKFLQTSPSAFVTVEEFQSYLTLRAKNGLRGEKPLALIAVLAYLHNNHIFGITFLKLLEQPHLSQIRTLFIELATEYAEGIIKNPSGSWSVITGSSKELQNAILKYKEGIVNSALSNLSLEEISIILKKTYSYLRQTNL